MAAFYHHPPLHPLPKLSLLTAIEQAHGVVFVVDAADPDRFDEARATLAETLADPALDGVPLLFLLNKKVRP